MTVHRPPSSQWELLHVGNSPPWPVWVWFSPPNMPGGVAFQVPADTLRGVPDRRLLTLRVLLEAAGVPLADVEWWSVAGGSYPGQGGQSPLFDQPVPDPPPNANLEIAVMLRPAMPAPVAAVAPVAEFGSLPPDADPGDIFDKIEVDWQASQLLESQTSNTRKRLADIMQQLNSLNRDLTPEERLHADRKDKSDWQTARRWLRDLATRVSKSIKDFDIGESSNAGQRERLTQFYEQQIVPRRLFDGLEQAQRDFETYRKLLSTLLSQMSSVLSNASTDGVQRAQQILRSIAASKRNARSKR